MTLNQIDGEHFSAIAASSNNRMQPICMRRMSQRGIECVVAGTEAPVLWMLRRRPTPI